MIALSVYLGLIASCVFLGRGGAKSGHNYLLATSLLLYVLVPGIVMSFRSETLFYSMGSSVGLDVVFLTFLIFTLGWILGQVVAKRIVPLGCVVGEANSWPQWVAWMTLAVSLPINGYLVVIGNASIEAARAGSGMSALWAFKNVHLLGLLFFAAMYFAGARNNKRAMQGFIVAAFFTAAVGLLEGRRTAVVLPILLYVSGGLFAGRVRLAQCLRMAFVLIGAILVTTGVRLFARDEFGVDFFVILDSIVGRLGAPLVAVAELLESSQRLNVVFDPQTIQVLIGGLSGGTLDDKFISHSSGNDFGYAVGLLDASETFTRINIGWVGELYAGYSWPGLFLGGALFGLLVASLWRGFCNNSFLAVYGRLFLTIFVISGFQLDIPHPFLRLVRALFLGLGLCLVGQLLPNGGSIKFVRRVRRGRVVEK